MKKIFILLFALKCISSFAQIINNKMPASLLKQIEDARFCGEVVITSYDTIKVGSTWSLSRINYFRMDINNSQSSTIHATGHEGSWPEIGDTCLVIVDKKCENFQCPVLAFAQIKKDKYIFWNPYLDSAKSEYEMDKTEFWNWYKKTNWQYTSNR